MVKFQHRKNPVSRPSTQFRARLSFTFREHGEDRRRWFHFPENGHRRVPMQMEGVEGLHTVGMWIEGERRFSIGDEVDVDCVVIWPEGFYRAAVPGTKFELWDSGFFASGLVTERFEEAWPKPPPSK